MNQICNSYLTGLQLSENAKNLLETMPIDDALVLEYALTNYKFIIIGKGWMTLKMFADEVEKVFLPEYLKNMEILRVLRQYSE